MCDNYNRAAVPGLSLETIIKTLNEWPKTPELELALADFMMLPQNEQMRILFLCLTATDASAKWCRDRIAEIMKK